MPERLSQDGGVLLSINIVRSEPVSGPERPGEILFYYLEGVGFRLKGFGVDAVDAFRAQGALPGVWTLLDSGETVIPAGQAVDLTTVSTPTPGEAALMVVASGIGTSIHVAHGSTASAPAAGVVLHDQIVTDETDTIIRARAGSGVSGFSLTWAVYKVVLP